MKAELKISVIGFRYSSCSDVCDVYFHSIHPFYLLEYLMGQLSWRLDFKRNDVFLNRRGDIALAVVRFRFGIFSNLWSAFAVTRVAAVSRASCGQGGFC